MDEKKILKRLAKVVLSRRSLWEYCKATADDFYKDSRIHLFILCDTLQKLYEKKLINPKTGKPYTKLAIHLPPQHGKSRTLVNFVNWVLGKAPHEKIICASYNDDIAQDFSQYVRDAILEERQEIDQITFKEIFPDVKIKRGTSSKKKWAIEGQHFTYIGAGLMGGSLTSKGGSIRIIDDPIKGAIDAYNPNYLEKVWLSYTGTFLSRASASGGETIDIFNMTRWSKNDPIGRLEKMGKLDDWYILKMEAYDKVKGVMLCPELLSFSAYKNLQSLMPEEIFKANYHQEPIELKGKMYAKGFQTYEILPDFKEYESRCYIDVADTGADYLCAIFYIKPLGQNTAYVTDVYFSDDDQSQTIIDIVKKIIDNKTMMCKIESNSGGMGFGRRVKELLRDKNNNCSIDMFTQSENKFSRIYTNSGEAQTCIFFQKGWNIKHENFYEALHDYSKKGKNLHDDAPDALTGVLEDTKDYYRTTINTIEDNAIVSSIFE